MGHRPDELRVLIPVLDRPRKVAQVLGSLRDTTPGAEVLFIADEGDEAEIKALKRARAQFILTKPHTCYARKINLGYKATTEPLLFTGADDILFRDGWFEAATALLDDEIKVVGTNDLANPRTIRGVHSTHTLFTRAYIEEESGTVDLLDTVLYPQYPHEYADDEFVQTAQVRGRYAHAFDAHVEHFHPIVGPHHVPDDDTYRRGRLTTRQGRNLFLRRRRMWRRLARK